MPYTRLLYLNEEKERKAPFQKQPPPKQAFLLELPDNTMHAVEMPDVAFRKEMTPKEPSAPSKEGMDFHPHLQCNVNK